MGDIVVATNVEISDPALQLTPGVGGFRVSFVPRFSLACQDSDATEIDLLVASVGDEHSLVARRWPGEGVTP
jgi:hypothetical protein